MAAEMGERMNMESCLGWRITGLVPTDEESPGGPQSLSFCWMEGGAACWDGGSQSPEERSAHMGPRSSPLFISLLQESLKLNHSCQSNPAYGDPGQVISACRRLCWFGALGTMGSGGASGETE